MDRVTVQQIPTPDIARLASLKLTQQLSLVGQLPGGALPPGPMRRAWRVLRDERGTVAVTGIADASMLRILPGPEHGSSVRETARAALIGGAPMVHVVLHDQVDEPDRIPGLTAHVYDGMPLATLLFCDLSEKISKKTRWVDDVVRHLTAWKQTLHSGHKLALFDLPPPRFDHWGRPIPFEGLEEQAAELRWRLEGVDAAAFAWAGQAGLLRSQGWRSPAALAGGALTEGGWPATRLLDAGVELPEGRKIDGSRAYLMASDREGAWARDFEWSPVLGINPVRLGSGFAVFEGQDLLRDALPIPAQRVLRYIHHTLVTTAEHFVFRNAVQTEAIALRFALESVCDRLAGRGLLAGVGQAGKAEVSAWVERGQTPSLLAEIAGRVPAWSTRVDVRFRVSDGTVREEEA